MSALAAGPEVSSMTASTRSTMSPIITSTSGQATPSSSLLYGLGGKEIAVHVRLAHEEAISQSVTAGDRP